MCFTFLFFPLLFLTCLLSSIHSNGDNCSLQFACNSRLNIAKSEGFYAKLEKKMQNSLEAAKYPHNRKASYNVIQI